MSLLMEALRKAEEAKRRMQQEEQAAAAGGEARERAQGAGNSAAGIPGRAQFTLEERETEVSPQYIREKFTSTQHQADPPVEHGTAGTAEPEPAPRNVPEPASSTSQVRRQQRAAAASVFAAKQSPARNRKTLTLLVIVMVLMIPVGGGVLWYLQSMPSSSIGINPNLANYDLASRQVSNTPAEPATPSPAAAAAETVAPAIAAETGTIAQPATTTTGQQPGAAQPEALAAETAPPISSDTVNAAAGPPAAASEPAAETLVAESPAPQVTAPLVAAPATPETTPAPAATNPAIVMEIARSNRGNQINPDLMAAYESFQEGDIPTARRLYQQVVDVVPNNRDALLGLASIDLRQANPAAARERYARLLQLNPRDPLAHTGLLQTLQVTDAAEHERTLKTLVSEYPDVAQLTLALGNLYASQERWSEAQGAYYNALLTASRGSGPVHPDYAFNLAVSLEQLNEPKAALDFYRQAKALAAEVTPGFDPQLLNSRLAYLEQAQP